MKPRLFWPGLMSVVGFLILVGLGAWQWQRLGEKRALIETIKARAGMTPQALPSPGASMEPAELDHMPVVLRGQFIGGQEAHVFFSLAKPVNGVGGAGFLVIEPFRLEDGRQVLVNRGFVPQAKKEPAARPGSGLEGPLTVYGVLRLPERANPFTNSDDPAKNVFYLRDPERIARGLRLERITGTGLVLPYIVDLTSPVPQGGLPMPVIGQIEIPNNHLQYALTWWSLAAVLATIFLIYAGQARRAPR